MKSFVIIVLSLTMLSVPSFSKTPRIRTAKPKATNPVRVKGRITPQGTYVAPSVRTLPNTTKADNYSTKGNVNPYTGKKGTVDPWN